MPPRDAIDARPRGGTFGQIAPVESIGTALRPLDDLVLETDIVTNKRSIRRGARRLALFGLALVATTLGPLFLVASASFGDFVVPSLEQRFERPKVEAIGAMTGVVALGGGDDRIREACRLKSAFPNLRVFISGAGDEPDIRRVLGPSFDSCRVEFENVSRNTRGNALVSAARLKSSATGEKWLLITSASHMPRAIGAFRQTGLVVEPWPVFDHPATAGKPGLVARHEVLGLAAYWLRGHTSELFPAPRPRAARS